MGLIKSNPTALPQIRRSQRPGALKATFGYIRAWLAYKGEAKYFEFTHETANYTSSYMYFDMLFSVLTLYYVYILANYARSMYKIIPSLFDRSLLLVRVI
jgi:hypothetical protein